MVVWLEWRLLCKTLWTITPDKTTKRQITWLLAQNLRGIKTYVVNNWNLRRSFWKWSHVNGRRALPVAMHYSCCCCWIVIMCFRRHNTSESTRVEGENKTLSLPPERNTANHTYRHTEPPDVLLSFQHQSSDMLNHIGLYVGDPWHVMLFTVLVLFPPTHLYCKSLPKEQVHKRTGTQTSISGSALLYDTSRHVESCPAPYFFKICDVTSFGFGQKQSIWC